MSESVEELSVQPITSSDSDKLFYAMKSESAELYDATIELVAPEYNLLHRAMMQIMAFHFAAKNNLASESAEIHVDLENPPVYPSSKGWILDIGSGIGGESLGLLSRFPCMNVVALDIAGPMHIKMKEAFELRFPEQVFESRVKSVTGDLLDYCGEKGSFTYLLPQPSSSDQFFDAIISTFTIHHFTAQTKLEDYKSIYRSLAPGGMFINADLFTFTSQQLADWAKIFDESWIVQQFDTPDAKRFPSAAKVGKDRRNYLKDMWMNHYQEFNKLGSVEDILQSAGGSETDVTGQARMLHEAGFVEIALPFRYWQMGVLCGTKDARVQDF